VKTVVLIQADPMKSHRAVEALRIALGLGSHNEGRDLRILLAGRSPYLLAEDISDVVDGEILEKHLPVFLEWGTTFHIAPDAETPSRCLPDCAIQSLTPDQIDAIILGAERVLVF
jgi:hypothetical protein